MTFLLVLIKFSLWQGDRALAFILWSLGTFLILSNFLRSNVLSRSATREAARIYHVCKYNCASFHLWWKQNFVKHQRNSKYYENDCGFLRSCQRETKYLEMAKRKWYQMWYHWYQFWFQFDTSGIKFDTTVVSNFTVQLSFNVQLSSCQDRINALILISSRRFIYKKWRTKFWKV